MSPSRWEYATLEWIWDHDSLRCTLPDGSELQERGSYVQVVALLSRLGGDGWEVAASTSSGNWIFWTLQRPLD